MLKAIRKLKKFMLCPIFSNFSLWIESLKLLIAKGANKMLAKSAQDPH